MFRIDVNPVNPFTLQGQFSNPGGWLNVTVQNRYGTELVSENVLSEEMEWVIPAEDLLIHVCRGGRGYRLLWNFQGRNNSNHLGSAVTLGTQLLQVGAPCKQNGAFGVGTFRRAKLLAYGRDLGNAFTQLQVANG